MTFCLQHGRAKQLRTGWLGSVVDRQACTQEEAAAAGRKKHVAQLRGQISQHEAERKRAEGAKVTEGRELQRKQAQDKAIVEVWSWTQALHCSPPLPSTRVWHQHAGGKPEAARRSLACSDHVWPAGQLGACDAKSCCVGCQAAQAGRAGIHWRAREVSCRAGTVQAHVLERCLLVAAC